MAPPPEYDKEPKAPDKSAANISTEDSKLLHNLTNDQYSNSDHKTANSSNSEVENNKHVETLDDEKLRALLDEAITYKCPKDREGKSILFKELLEEVEQDEQACEAAARSAAGARGGGGGRRGVRSRRTLQHSNSLQDLVAALAAEPAPRRSHRHPPPPSVSARAIHGGSLPSGVDTSSLLPEEGAGNPRAAAAGYLATVRCVNPPPLAERRVSASDANTPHELDMLNRRRAPMFPMTYTARATLEIGSGAVCSGRAVTTTTASNHQVRTLLPPPHRPRGPRPRPHPPARARSPARPSGGGDAAAGPTSRSTALHMWYRGIDKYCRPLREILRDRADPADNKRAKTNAYIPSADGVSSASVDVKSLDRGAPEEGPAPLSENESQRRRSDVHRDEPGETRDHRRSKNSDREDSDISIMKKYRERLGHITFKKPTVESINPRNIRSLSIAEPDSSCDVTEKEGSDDTKELPPNCSPDDIDAASSGETNASRDVCIDIEIEPGTSKCETSPIFEMNDIPASARNNISNETNIDKSNLVDYIELEEIVCHRSINDNDTAFSDFVAEQENLLHILETSNLNTFVDDYSVLSNNNNTIKLPTLMSEGLDSVDTQNEDTTDMTDKEGRMVKESGDTAANNEVVVQLNTKPEEKASGVRYILAELPNNAYIFLTLPKRFVTPPNRDDTPSLELSEIENNNNVKPLPEKAKTKKEKPGGSKGDVKKSDNTNKSALALLFENFLKDDNDEMTEAGEGSSVHVQEVDAGIPFSCITTPEVVTTCSTASSAPHQPQPVDPKPRSVVASNFNGLPLSRPNYGSTSSTANDEYKKSLDENGNAVQGYSSPLSGSSQHKKPRRKKSSKNETVIDCRQLDGYQGDKDVNELLRFIESNAETRVPKLRAKHKDDADDKTAKKRSTERRKDKEKVKRASSLEELSRTKLEDLTASRPAPAPVKPERRSWGDAAPAPAPASPPPPARPAPLDPLPALPPEPLAPPAPEPAAAPEPEPAPPAPDPVAEQADFQTVTKKRKTRRKTDEPAPRRARAPSPRARQESAPPSDRSNDSNDDMDSVHSLPEPRAAPPPPPPPPPPPASHASYADIARTRHNIPDLIESCNFYAEGEPGPEPRRSGGDAAASAPPEPDGYPALESRAAAEAAGPRRARDAKPAAARRDRKEKPGGPGEPAAAECPAPDVVADRRPPVILLDSGARGRDMDGVTFGFDINEQLLGGGARRPRCDLVRDAVEGAAAALPVRAGCLALRYLPPDPPPDTPHLHHLVDYVGSAWEEVMRCGGGKVRYYSE